jgi:hypothetical protein
MLHAHSALQVNLHQLLGLHDVIDAPLGIMQMLPPQNVHHALLDLQLQSQEHHSATNALLERFLQRLPHLFVSSALLENILYSIPQHVSPAHPEREVSNLQQQVHLKLPETTLAEMYPSKL